MIHFKSVEDFVGAILLSGERVSPQHTVTKSVWVPVVSDVSDML